MSILGSNNNTHKMGVPSFHEFKKQASFFFKEKIKTARLALTDVTPAQLLTEEATNGNPWAPDARSMKMISRAAFEVDDYYRIVEVLHKRLASFDRKNWRVSYKAVIVLEHLLTHGPESVAEEFQTDKDVLKEMGSFQHIDEKGFNWGLQVGMKSEKILKLLDEGPFLKEEKDRARKLSRGIQGFGSFCNKTSSAQSTLQESSFPSYGRSNSQFNDHVDQENQILPSYVVSLDETRATFENENTNLVSSKKAENFDTQTSLKENMVPKKEDLDERNYKGESKPLLSGQEDNSTHEITIEEQHPFNNVTHLTTVSLLST